MNFISKPRARQFHRFIAYTVAVLLLWMTVTGFLLNHSDTFKLSDHKIQQQWLLDWYHIELPQINQSFPVGSHWLTTTNQGIYRDNQKLLATNKKIEAVVQSPQMTFVVLMDSVLVFTNQGEFIDSIAFPSQLKIGASQEINYQSTENDPFIVTKLGQAWRLDANMTQLHKVLIDKIKNLKTLKPITQHVPPKEIRTSLRQSANPLTLEKVMVELHNGLFFGSIGPWLLDLLALIFILMIISGIRLHLKK